VSEIKVVAFLKWWCGRPGPTLSLLCSSPRATPSASFVLRRASSPFRVAVQAARCAQPSRQGCGWRRNVTILDPEKALATARGSTLEGRLFKLASVGFARFRPKTGRWDVQSPLQRLFPFPRGSSAMWLCRRCDYATLCAAPTFQASGSGVWPPKQSALRCCISARLASPHSPESPV